MTFILRCWQPHVEEMPEAYELNLNHGADSCPSFASVVQPWKRFRLEEADNISLDE